MIWALLRKSCRSNSSNPSRLICIANKSSNRTVEVDCIGTLWDIIRLQGHGEKLNLAKASAKYTFVARLSQLGQMSRLKTRRKNDCASCKMADAETGSPDFPVNGRVRRKLPLSKRLKTGEPVKTNTNPRAVFFGAFGSHYETRLNEWSESSLREFFVAIGDRPELPVVTLVRCVAEVVIVDFIYRQLIYINPNKNSPFKRTWKKFGAVDFRLIELDLAREEVAQLRGVSFVEKLTYQLASVYLQLRQRFKDACYDITDAPEPLRKTLRTGLTSHREDSELFCEKGGKYSIAEIRPVLEMIYPHLYNEITSPHADSDPLFLINMSRENRWALLCLPGIYTKSQQNMLWSIVGVFKNCLRVYREAPAILLSHSIETELFDFFVNLPKEYDIGIYIKLHAISRQMEVKDVDE